MMKKFFLILVIALSQISCGGGSRGGDALDPGLYTGTIIYRDEGGPHGGCLDFIRQCFSIAQLQISQQYESDGSSRLLIESDNGDIIAEAAPLSSRIDYIQVLSKKGPCGFVGGDVYCSGVRDATVESVSKQERIISFEGQITATCSSDAGSFSCEIQEEGELQG